MGGVYLSIHLNLKNRIPELTKLLFFFAELLFFLPNSVIIFYDLTRDVTKILENFSQSNYHIINLRNTP